MKVPRQGKERSSMIKRWLMVPVVLAGSGCGNRVGLSPVTGKVLYKGEPASGAVVYFHREDTPRAAHQPIPFGIVEDDGRFSLTSDGLGDGCPPGKYAVLVEWKGKPDPQVAPPRPARGKAKAAPVNRRTARDGVDRLGGRYFDISRPRLHAEVVARTTDLAPFELGD
jgi:hypothetical protein